MAHKKMGFKEMVIFALLLTFCMFGVAILGMLGG